jgi:hypothetical protein
MASVTTTKRVIRTKETAEEIWQESFHQFIQLTEVFPIEYKKEGHEKIIYVNRAHIIEIAD